jgi:hypothetical protein
MRTREEQASVGLDELASMLAGKLDKVSAGAGAADE